MGILGSVGKLYMFILLVLLFLGSGFALWSFINFISDRNKKKSGIIDKKPVLNLEGGSNSNKNSKMIGGIFMNNNGWLKLVVFSFVGILASVIILGFISTGNNSAMSAHQQHQQQGSMDMTMQGGMNANTQMGNMQMQGSMNGNMGMQYNANIQQQLNQIQQQIYQLQQQLNNGMSGNMQMQQGGMGNMGNMGGMGMMGGMGNMQQNNNMNNMNNMQQSGGSSMSGMGMM